MAKLHQIWLPDAVYKLVAYSDPCQPQDSPSSLSGVLLVGADQIFRIDEHKLSLLMVYDLSKERQASPIMGMGEDDDDLLFVDNALQLVD